MVTPTHTVTYAARSNAVTVTVGSGADDGEGSETTLPRLFENVTGGSGAESPPVTVAPMSCTGGGAIDTLTGGAGTDTLNGDAGGDTLNGGADATTPTVAPMPTISNGGGAADTENGGDGNDSFDQESATNGGDTLNGDADTDSPHPRSSLQRRDGHGWVRCRRR